MKIIKKILPFILFAAGIILPQTASINIPLTITDGAGSSAQLVFGLDPSATDGIDVSLGETELPPSPPSGVFDARFIGDDIGISELGQGTLKDLRQGNSSFNGTVIYELKYQAGTGNSITISWNLPEGVTGTLQDVITGTVFNAEMVGSDSTTVSNLNINKLKMTVNYTQATGRSIVVSSPNGGEYWIAGSSHNITWTSSGITDVKIEYSADGDMTWNTVVSSTPAGTGSYSWKIPVISTAQCKVRIIDTGDSLIGDSSDFYFSISQTNNPQSVDVPLTVTDNTGGSAQLVFGLDPSATDDIDTTLGEAELPPSPPSGVFDARFIGDDIGISGLGQGTLRDYRQGTSTYNGTKVYELKYQAGTGTSITISWNLPDGITGTLQDLITGTLLNIPMTGNGNATVFNLSINKLKMTIQYAFSNIVITKPEIGKYLQIDDTASINWTFNSTSKVKLELFKNNLFYTVIADSLENRGYFNWKIPEGLKPDSDYNIKVSSISDTNFYSMLPQNITISRLNIISPNGGENEKIGYSCVIKWSNSQSSGVNIELYKDDIFYKLLKENYVNSDSLMWDIGTDITADSNYKVRVSLFGHPEVYDLSDNYFTVLDFATGVNIFSIPITYNLAQNYPNPFNPNTVINYSVPNTGMVNIKIYDMLGNEVATLVNEVKSPGMYKVNFDAGKFASGVYFYRMQAGSFSSVKKLLLVK